MAEDPYKTLGVERTATADEIRRAFRNQAKNHHPDLHPGDAAAEAKFKSLNAAHGLLSDADTRGKFDRGEVDAEGQPVPDRAFYRDYAQQSGGARYRPGHRQGGPQGASQDSEDMGDIFDTLFREQANRPRRGQDRSYRLDVPFLDTVTGATERLTLPNGATLDVRIPPGLEDGQILRLRGKGDPGHQGAPDGDALITVSVFPHPAFRREGSDLHMDLPVTFAEAVLGAKIQAPTPQGPVTLTVPPRSDAGTRLRLRGRGVAAHGGHPAGDLHVTLSLVAGPIDDALEQFLRGWAPSQDAFDPRKGLVEEAP